MSEEPRLDNPIEEIDDAMLRDAVQRIRAAEMPTEYVERSLDGAKRLLAVADSVQENPADQESLDQKRLDQKTSELRSRRIGYKRLATALRRPRVLAVLAAGILLAATLLTYSVRESREAWRRMASTNDFKQIGLATHNYHSHFQRPVQGTNWFGLGVDLQGGTDLVYEIDPKTSLGYHMQVPAAFSAETTFAKNTNGSGKMVAHSAVLRLLVDEFSQTHSRLNALVQKHVGTIASSDVSAQSGESRSGTWTILVPADSRDAVLDELAELGVLQSRTTRSSDMTEQYVDLQARIANKQGLEKRILGLLEKHTGDIKDVIAVEEQLARVRQEIETMQAKTKNIQSVVAMTSIAVSAMEKDDYVPPKADRPPTFINETVGAFSSSAGAIVGLFQSLVLVFVLIVPWLPIVAIGGYIVRRLYRKRVGQSPV